TKRKRESSIHNLVRVPTEPVRADAGRRRTASVIRISHDCMPMLRVPLQHCEAWPQILSEFDTLRALGRALQVTSQSVHRNQRASFPTLTPFAKPAIHDANQSGARVVSGTRTRRKPRTRRARSQPASLRKVKRSVLDRI